MKYVGASVERFVVVEVRRCNGLKWINEMDFKPQVFRGEIAVFSTILDDLKTVSRTDIRNRFVQQKPETGF